MDTGPVIVSAYIKLERDVPDKPVQFYVDKGKAFMRHFAAFKKVVFMDRAVISHFGEGDDNTRIIPTSLEELYLHKYKNLLRISVNTDNAEKDSANYFMVQCHKTEWIKQAIESDAFSSQQYIWIDIGIDNILKTPINTTALTHVYPLIRIGSIWDLDKQYGRDPYRSICWYFAGTVFGGHRDALVEFARIQRDMCMLLVTEKNTLTWEVNIWYLLWRDRPDLFLPYRCDHDSSIINLY
jgi:hypothetical protein